MVSVYKETIIQSGLLFIRKNRTSPLVCGIHIPVYLQKEQNTNYQNLAFVGRKNVAKPVYKVFSVSHENLRIYCHAAYVSRSSHKQRLQRSNAQIPPSFSDLGHAPADRALRQKISFWGRGKDGPQLFVWMFISESEWPLRDVARSALEEVLSLGERGKAAYVNAVDARHVVWYLSNTEISLTKRVVLFNAAWVSHERCISHWGMWT